MLTFFRINDPFRIIGVLTILIMIRAPYILNDLSITIPELNWMLIGSRMSEGNRLYQDIWDSIAPLSAVIYWFVDIVFGKSVLAYHVISIILVTFQAFIFNQYLIRLGIYHEKTYIPALLYSLFMCVSVDFYTLSPVLLSLTFLLFVLRNIFRLDDKAVDQEIFKTGLYLGIATLFYFPSVFFLVTTLLGLALFKTSSARYLLLLIYGFLFVILLYGIYLYYFNLSQEFYILCIRSFFLGKVAYYHSYIDLFWIGLIPLFLLIISIFRVTTEGKFVNFQTNSQQIMIIWALVSIPTLIFNHQIAGYQMIILVPAISFFLSHYLLLIKRKWLSEIYFLLIFSVIIWNNFNYFYNIIPVINKVSYKSELVIPNNFSNQNKKILVLGDDLSYYQGNKIVTPYLNWNLSQSHFGDLDRYSIVLSVLDNISREYPELIIDTTDKQVSMLLFKKAPQLAEVYSQRKEGNILIFEYLPNK